MNTHTNGPAAQPAAGDPELSDTPASDSATLQAWGGLECTVNRVGERFFDQIHRCGHVARAADDFERIAQLGLRTLRYGLHWERYAHTGSWLCFDQPLAAMRHAGIEPIAGLLHHGSGPRGTSLLDPEFGEKLAAYAGSVAGRYPWITRYTPVNEPNTTARFSGMYGHWYPHHRSRVSFVRALLNQTRGTVLAMRAVRQVQPAAELISTEDGGRTWSTPELASVCEQREWRRWLGTDLLCGMVDRRHPLFRWLLQHGATESEVLWFRDNPCPPQTIGLNYYVTSDRFLDHRTELYPHYLAGGDTGSEPYVDVEAVRVRPESIAGAQSILTDAWQRYGIPVAITEAHLGCDVDEQLRWLAEVWHGAQTACRTGVDCRAVTVWALLGSFDWCNLVTNDRGIYESGVFDLRFQPPHETELGHLVRQMTAGRALSHAALQRQGWWHHADRLLYGELEALAA